ncbi:MAG: radical SAM protein [Bacteroidaceae bacterium]|nr:radical SAM protein [Bacteroidaceae bacterium]
MNKMRINEIFYSLQGEGRYTGTPAVFIRMAGCNLRCPFCDTQHETFVEISEEEIVAEARKYPTRTVVITGGEPVLQLTPLLTDLLHKDGFAVHLETNGTLRLPDGVTMDWITCSPKEGAVLRLDAFDELKVVYYGQDMSPFDSLTAREYRLQPMDTGDPVANQKNQDATIDYILNHPKWTLSLQTHKILKLQ